MAIHLESGRALIAIIQNKNQRKTKNYILQAMNLMLKMDSKIMNTIKTKHYN
jgi:hypothetical protein